jgi:hypothetical protein
MNKLDHFFKQSLDPDNIKLPKHHTESINKHFEFVKGSDFYKGYYDTQDVETKFVRFFQIALFCDYPKKIIEKGIAILPTSVENKKCVRSFLLKGKSSKGSCFFEWEVLEIKNYKITEKNLNVFIDCLNVNKNNKKTNIRIKHKFYPVYNFDFTDPPTGQEINECVSELLYNN